jgi:hypothetical protein
MATNFDSITPLQSLPWQLGDLPNLEELLFDTQELRSPPPEVWELGTAATVRFLTR